MFGPFHEVIEVGGLDINGTVRGMFPGSIYTSVDVQDGPGVDVVGDAVHLTRDGKLPSGVDCVVTTEALEHYPHPWNIIDSALMLLRPGGVLIATMAGPGRQRHSGIHGGVLEPGEHYRNIEPRELTTWLDSFSEFEVDVVGSDVRCWAIR